MLLKILEDRHLEHVPGTALLEELSLKTLPTLSESSKLKHATGMNSHIVLVPQPSDDPRDPLNWPVWKREALFWSLCFTAGVVTSMSTMLAPGYALLGKQWGVSVNSVASAASFFTLCAGCMMPFESCIAIKYGRRPVFLLSAAVLFICSIWTAVSQGLTSFLVSRVFQGFGAGAFQYLVPTTIGDIYFVHQRGVRVAIWNFAVVGGVNIAHIVNGFIIQSPHLGWRWTYWIIAIFLGISLVLMLLFAPETAYETHAAVAVRNFSDVSSVCERECADPTGRSEKGDANAGQHQTEVSRRDHLPPKTFLEELKPWSGYINRTPLSQIMLRQMHFLLSPTVWFAIVSQGLTTSWYYILVTISSVVFALPPLNFTATETGLVSVGPLVAGIICAVISGPLCDYSAVWFSRRNKGIYEPEFRLFLLLPMLLLEVAGYGFWGLMYGGAQWIGPVVMYSLITLGADIGATGIFTYVIDVHQGNAPECFAFIKLSTAVTAFGFAQFAVKWVEAMGVPHTFGILAALTALCILMTMPMYVYGKRVRGWMHRHPKLSLVDQDRC